MTTRLILAASRDAGVADIIRQSIGDDYTVEMVDNAESCMSVFGRKRYEITFIDIELLLDCSEAKQPDKAVESFIKIFPTAQIVVLAPTDRISEAVEAVKAGATEYMTYPLIPEELKYMEQSIREALLMQSELDYLRDKVWLSDSTEVVRTNSPQMVKVFNNVKLVARTRSTVLLTGETGTGKSLIAKLIHRQSDRSEQQFIAVHCGAIPDNLLESELFGHEKGAFTGAVRKKLGKFEIAHGGTIFLDEIGTLTPSAQIKLLQVLQEKTFQRVGGNVELETDVRIIAATNNDLWEMAEQGAFRRDLLFRLNVFPIEIPPLRERRQDISALASEFIKKLNKEYLKEIRGAKPSVIEALKRYDWPGNVRELKNIIERAFIIENSEYLTRESFPSEFFANDGHAPGLPLDADLSLAEVRQQGIEHIEKQYLRKILAKHKGKINKTAENAGISTRQLHKLMTRYGLHKEEFKLNHSLMKVEEV